MTSYCIMERGQHWFSNGLPEADGNTLDAIEELKIPILDMHLKITN